MALSMKDAWTEVLIWAVRRSCSEGGGQSERVPSESQHWILRT